MLIEFIWVSMAVTGEYADLRSWPIRAWPTKEEAVSQCMELTAVAKAQGVAWTPAANLRAGLPFTWAGVTRPVDYTGVRFEVLKVPADWILPPESTGLGAPRPGDVDTTLRH
jgi:hypothetical protein